MHERIYRLTFEMITGVRHEEEEMKVIGCLITIAFLVACGSQQQFDLAPVEATFGQTVHYNDKVDILWVVDDSTTMGQHQSRIGEQAEYFIDALVATKLDFHLGITSTDRGKNGGRLVGNPRILKRHSSNLKGAFAKNIKLPVGSPVERGLLSMQEALSPENLHNAGFVRKDSVLVVIFLSDEDDQSSGAVSDYLQFLDQLKPNFPSGQKAWVAHFIGALESTPECLAFGPDANPGYRYMELTNYSGGTNESVCTSDLRKALTNIRKQILELLVEFRLDREPITETIKVYVNGIEIPNDPVDGWTYSDRIVRFHGSSVPPADARIVIDFKPKSYKE